MKPTTILLFCIAFMQNIIIFSQENLTDSKGLKQGTWIYSKTDTVTSNVMLVRSENTAATQKAPEKKAMKFVLESGNYIDNKRNGDWVINYYKKGEPDNYKIYSVTYSNDSIKKIVSYYRDGKVKADISYQNNEPIGPFKVYYPDGQVHYEGSALKGVVFFKGTEYYISAGSYYNRPKNCNKQVLEKENIDIKTLLANHLK